MAKEELLEMRGKVVELLPNAMFRVELEHRRRGRVDRAAQALPGDDDGGVGRGRLFSRRGRRCGRVLRRGLRVQRQA